MQNFPVLQALYNQKIEGKIIVIKFLTLFLMSLFALDVSAELETTPYGKIVGIETRAGAFHVQTNFAGGSKNGCPVNVGATYMYDFIFESSRNTPPDASVEISVLLAAFAAQKDVSFHIYGCNSSGSRPQIGYIRVKQ